MANIFKSPAAKNILGDFRAGVDTLFKNTLANTAQAAMNTKAGETFKTAATNSALERYTPHIIVGVLVLLVAGALAARYKVLK